MPHEIDYRCLVSQNNSSINTLTWCLFGVVDRTYKRVGFKEVQYLFFIKAVVTACHHIDIVTKQFYTILFCQPKSMAGILIVSDHKIYEMLLSKTLEVTFYN